MGDIKFNVSKAQVGYYAGLPAANDALIAVVLEATGLVDDDTLADYTTLSAILAGASNEQTTMGRKTLASVAVAQVGTGTTATVDITANDVVWSAASGNVTGAVVICYDPDTTTGTDADLIPLSKQDFVETPAGGPISFKASTGFLRVI